MSMRVIRVHYFVCSLRLFSCNLLLLFIRQHNEGRSVAQHASVVLLFSGISVPCCCSCGYSSHSIRWCIALKFLTHTVPPSLTYVSITWAHIPQLYLSQVRLEGSLCSLGVGGTMSIHIRIKYVILFSDVVCSQYRVSLSHCRERVNPTLVACDCVVVCGFITVG